MASLIRVIASAVLLASVAGVAAAQAPACDRRCLEGWVDRYLDALIRHDTGAVPLKSGARYTENGQRLAVGDGLWRSAKAKGKYRLVVADTEAQQVALIGTLDEFNADPDMGTPALIALRLKIVGNEIAEVEQFIARNVDAAKRVEALGRPHPLFTQPIPEAERMSRADLIATAKTTNRPTPAGETRPNPATAANYSAQWSCREQFESGLLHFVTRIRDRRFVAVDEERGLVFSFVFFDHAAGDTRNFTAPSGRPVTAGPAQPWTWYIAELFKVEKGQLRQIEATLERVPYGMTSGWSSWEDGMSDRARDVTR
jgi:hypothetical protein